LTSDEPESMLKGTTLEVYRFLLRGNRPVGAREVQRALNLSTPSLAVYHLSKLEDVGLLKREDGGYVINKVVLEDGIKISRFLIPRFLFYAVFAVLLLVTELTVLRPTVVTGEYFFATSGTFICALAFWYETVKVWRKGGF
jgi:DNA-binding transcriptional ArsR family regulator